MLERSWITGVAVECSGGVERNWDVRITRAVDEMESRLAEPLRIRELAHAVNLSVSRFAHLFRQQTGLSPGRYLRLVRMERARVLLERTTLPVTDVMMLVGCTDPSHFSKDFRRHVGVGPRDYRRAVLTSAVGERSCSGDR
jgi:AraC family transcriptional regulator, arabinose operon regulatory protein